MEIRRYRVGEEPAIWRVYFDATHQSNARDYHPDLLNRWAPPDQDMNQWAERLAQKNPFVAIVGDQIVGMAELEGDGFIDYFYVHPESQNQGIGTALLRAVESEASRLGVSVLFADVSVTAKDFFLAQGFDIVESRASVILGHPAPNFRMQKTLKSRDR